LFDRKPDGRARAPGRDPGVQPGELYEAYGGRVYRFCRRLCGNPSDAEDLAADVFLAAFEGWERFEGRSSVATWLFRIAVFRWRALSARRRPEVVPLDAAEFPGGDPAPGQIEALEIERAIAALPEPLREALLLVKVEGFKYREAAGILGVPQGTLQSRVHDAVVRLRRELGEEPAPRSTGAVETPRVGKGCANEL
jgi:RNA polymerase sigma-70 factor (ECF subfamily)